MKSPDLPPASVEWKLPLFIVGYLILFVLLSRNALRNPSVVWGIFPWIAAFLALPTGLMAFWLRQRHRISYGLLELAVGIYLTASVLLASLLGTYQNRSIVGVDVFAGLLAVYVIVRALDNIGKGLKKLGTGKPDSFKILRCKFATARREVKKAKGWSNRCMKIRDHWELIFGFD